MDWKEVFKVSLIVGVISYFIQLLVTIFSEIALVTRNYEVVSIILGPLATAFILDEKLKNKWGVFVGIIITFLVTVILSILFHALDFFRLY